MSISQGVVGPNRYCNEKTGKGKRLIFRYYFCMRGNTSSVSDAWEEAYRARQRGQGK